MTRFWLIFTLLAALLPSNGVSAGEPSRLVWNTGTSSFMCSAFTATEACSPLAGGVCTSTEDCVFFPASSSYFCMPKLDFETICCSANEDCPAQHGQAGVCRQVNGVDATNDFNQVCVYPGEHFCRPQAQNNVVLQAMVRCLAPADNASTSPIYLSWVNGDCDQDGLSNPFPTQETADADPCPCDPTNTCDGSDPTDPGPQPIDNGSGSGSGSGGTQNSGATDGGSDDPPADNNSSALGSTFRGQGGCQLVSATHAPTPVLWCWMLVASLYLRQRVLYLSRSRHRRQLD